MYWYWTVAFVMWLYVLLLDFNARKKALDLSLFFHPRELTKLTTGPLTTIFRQSLETSQLPDDWRNAYITPIFKKGNCHESSNYRPILLTSECCKLLEYIVCSHIRDRASLMSTTSYPDSSTVSAKDTPVKVNCFLTVNDLAAYHDRKVQVDIAVLDFSKAFDVVPHKSLMRKLTHYGIGCNVHNWIRSFLMERQQQVIVDGEQSMKVHVDSGVPQGTVMGPLLFLLYINALPGHVTSTVRLFADDCLLYRPIRTPDDQVKLQKDLHALTIWATTWGMKFNPSKCHILTTCKNVRLPVQIYSLCECALSHVPDTRYLGITIQEDLHWRKHINSLTANASQTLGFLQRNLRDCCRELKQLAYFSLVRSWLEYMAVDIDALERVGRGGRFVCGNYRRERPA